MEKEILKNSTYTRIKLEVLKRYAHMIKVVSFMHALAFSEMYTSAIVMLKKSDSMNRKRIKNNMKDFMQNCCFYSYRKHISF